MWVDSSRPAETIAGRATANTIPEAVSDATAPSNRSPHTLVCSSSDRPMNDL